MIDGGCRSEDGMPLETPNGARPAAAIPAFGFPLHDRQRGFESLPGERCVAWPGDAVALYEGDEFHKQVNEHVRLYANPAYRSPQCLYAFGGRE